MTQDLIERCVQPVCSPFVCCTCDWFAEIPEGQEEVQCAKCKSEHEQWAAEYHEKKRQTNKAVRLLTRRTTLRKRDIPQSVIELKIAQLKLKKLICQHHKTSTN